MKIVGISMIRNDADIVEPFVRHALRVLDHLFVIVHCPQDGTGEILSALHAEGLPMTLVFDGEPAFLQGERLTWLARAAFAAFRPDYVFPPTSSSFRRGVPQSKKRWRRCHQTPSPRAFACERS
jgi:hypothetical protein